MSENHEGLKLSIRTADIEYLRAFEALQADPGDTSVQNHLGQALKHVVLLRDRRIDALEADLKEANEVLRKDAPAVSPEEYEIKAECETPVAEVKEKILKHGTLVILPLRWEVFCTDYGINGETLARFPYHDDAHQWIIDHGCECCRVRDLEEGLDHPEDDGHPGKPGTEPIEIAEGMTWTPGRPVAGSKIAETIKEDARRPLNSTLGGATKIFSHASELLNHHDFESYQAAMKHEPEPDVSMTAFHALKDLLLVVHFLLAQEHQREEKS